MLLIFNFHVWCAAEHLENREIQVLESVPSKLKCNSSCILLGKLIFSLAICLKSAKFLLTLFCGMSFSYENNNTNISLKKC